MNEKDIVTWLNGYAEGILFAISRIGPSENASEEVTVKQIESKPEAKPQQMREKMKEKAKGNQSARKVDKGKVIALHNAGWGAKKICEEMHCSDATVYTILKEYRESQGKKE